MLVNGQADIAGPSHGVRVRRVSNTLELVVPVRQGASVTVEPRGNRLDLVVSGGGGALNVENFPTDARGERAKDTGARGARGQAQQEQAAQEQSREDLARLAQQSASKRRGQGDP